MTSSFICLIIVRIIVSFVFYLTPHSISRVVSCGVREVSDVTSHSM